MIKLRKHVLYGVKNLQYNRFLVILKKKRKKYCRICILVCDGDMECFLLPPLARGDPSKLSPFGLEGLGEIRGCMRNLRPRRWGDEFFTHRYGFIIAGLDEAQMSNT